MALSQWIYLRIDIIRILNFGVWSVKRKKKILNLFSISDLHGKDTTWEEYVTQDHPLFTYFHVYLPLIMGLKPPLKRALLLSVTMFEFMQNTFHFSGRAVTLSAKRWEP